MCIYKNAALNGVFVAGVYVEFLVLWHQSPKKTSTYTLYYLFIPSPKLRLKP